MARPVRLEYAGAVYHLMARGNQGRPICVEDAHRKMWVAALGEACGRTGWRIHAWVLMGNHFHLLLVEWGLGRLGLSREELASRPKGRVEKPALAWWLHGQRTARRRWIAEALRMGYESRVSQAISWVEANRTQKVVGMKRKLEAYRA